MIKYLRSMSFGKLYYLENENTKQVAIFEYIERIDKEHFKFKMKDEKGQIIVLPVNQMKRILTEYDGTLDGKSCENCRYFDTSEVKQNKNRPIANCKKCGWEIYHKTPCFNYEEN